jgi:hypothetical protein
MVLRISWARSFVLSASILLTGGLYPLAGFFGGAGDSNSYSFLSGRTSGLADATTLFVGEDIEGKVYSLRTPEGDRTWTGSADGDAALTVIKIGSGGEACNGQSSTNAKVEGIWAYTHTALPSSFSPTSPFAASLVRSQGAPLPAPSWCPLLPSGPLPCPLF